MVEKEKARLVSGPLPKLVLADGSDLSASLPPIQADPAAERRFALALAERVFGSRPVLRHRRATV